MILFSAVPEKKGGNMPFEGELENVLSLSIESIREIRPVCIAKIR